MTNDLTFFTNEPDETLLDRFKATLNHVQYFDVLVGYFRSSGFHLLYESFEQIEKIRILVGLNVDRKTFEIIDHAQGQLHLNFESHQQTQNAFSSGLAQEMEHSPDTYDTEIGVKKFVEFIQSGKLEIKAHPSQNIHAKVYISRFPEGHYDYGRVITGSSNFSQSGLVGNYEFNVELKNSADVKYALEKFEALWLDAVDISEAYIDTINKRTWLNDQISPYELYLKFLYEYFKEEINVDQDIDVHLPPGFLELEYQKQATVSARKILDSYNGVFLADVVGLGKTFISALLAQQLPGKKLIICPPVLKEYWERTFYEFNVSVVVESMGKLDHIIKKNPDRFDYVFVDEAHRFRNEVTQSYEKLHHVCWGKKIILVSATPLNNTIEDIYSQLKLFQAPKKSLIPGVPNLERFFAERRKYLNQFDKGTPEYFEAVKTVAQQVRTQILNHVMVRRTRKEIVNFFSEDISKQGLSFPELADPERIIYTFDPQTDAVFNQTIILLQEFSYSRYTPLLYLKKGLSEFEAQSQRNVGGFMKGTLVKRLESSFFAFKRSLGRFIESYERFIDMYHQGTLYISKHVNVYDLLDADDEARLLELVEQEKAQKYKTSVFRPDFLNDLQRDLQALKQIQTLWADIDQDPKLDQFVTELRRNKLLKGKKVIVFSESAETGSYLYQKLDEQFPDKVMFYSSGGGQFQRRGISKSLARDLIEANYDPNYPSQQQNDIRID
jgi:HKD family nuclease